MTGIKKQKQPQSLYLDSLSQMRFGLQASLNKDRIPPLENGRGQQTPQT